jgi:hypothetical protein
LIISRALLNCLSLPCLSLLCNNLGNVCSSLLVMKIRHIGVFSVRCGLYRGSSRSKTALPLEKKWILLRAKFDG